MKSLLPFLRISSIWACVIPHRLSFSADAARHLLTIGHERAGHGRFAAGPTAPPARTR